MRVTKEHIYISHGHRQQSSEGQGRDGMLGGEGQGE